MSLPVRNHFFLGIFTIFGQIKELSPSNFEKLIIFLVKILCYGVGRADLPFPGQDRVLKTQIGNAGNLDFHGVKRAVTHFQKNLIKKMKAFTIIGRFLGKN